MPFYSNKTIPSIHYSSCPKLLVTLLIMSSTSIIPDLNLLGVLGDVAVDSFVDVATLATRYPEDQVIEGCTTEDINMVAYFNVSVYCSFL